MLLIIGGIVIAAITLGGYYASRNPGKVARLFSSPEQVVDVSILETTLTAPPDCAGLSSVMFKSVCGKRDIEPVPLWSEGLDEASRNCLYASFSDTILYMMQYRREPAENFKDYDNDLGVISHACEIVEDLPDAKIDDTAALLDLWYKKRRADMKAVQ